MKWKFLFFSMFIRSHVAEPLKQTNLLLIMFDDLRPELSIYGRQHMVTPNFERLAKRSIVFDYAFSQVAVCNPSRDSLLTGLRPDTTGTYNFQQSYWGHLILPTQLSRSGYNTAGVGKILHWDGANKDIWNYYQYDNDWYGYQGREEGFMNSSAMPDKIHPEEWFRDHDFSRKAVQTLENLTKEPKYFMLGVGFKLPHLALHVPHKYYEIYKNKDRMNAWKLSKRELRFPPTTSEISWRCCAGNLDFMREEGALRFNRSVWLGDINVAFTNEMRDELMMGYCAGVSFVDKQVGKLLDVMDRHNLWQNTTVVLTADHGMHNGEKGIWEKWTLFDESLRVPLLISHPQSPFQGQRYHEPVELIDVYATLNELLAAPSDPKKIYKDVKKLPLQGKSLAPVVLGSQLWQQAFPAKIPLFKTRNILTNNTSSSSGSSNMVNNNSSSSLQAIGMPQMERNYAITQSTRCAKKKDISIAERDFVGKSSSSSSSSKRTARRSVWDDCNVDYKGQDEVSLLGYSLRTPDYRYTAYFYFNKTSFLGKQVHVDIQQKPFQQELYDHKNETLADFTHRELVNLAYKPSYAAIVKQLKAKIVHFIQSEAVFHRD
mmetsp:Transcript_22497/g.32337  ORF Transcript_22497/g.32337 Transcript_22497/m.32337 type:complete len:601 (-) Transcript_22497:131-1933(-)